MSIMSHEERLKIHVEIQIYASLNMAQSNENGKFRVELGGDLRFLIKVPDDWSKLCTPKIDEKRLTATLNIDIF